MPVTRGVIKTALLVATGHPFLALVSLLKTAEAARKAQGK